MDDARWLISHLRLCLVFAVSMVMAGCLATGDEVDEVSLLPDFSDLRLSGSVGDGPIVGATMTLKTVDGTVLAEFESSGEAGYDITVRTRPRQYPLTIEARGGIDLVTGEAPDFELNGTVIAPLKHAVSNINPYSTLALEIAGELSGGLTRSNIGRAESIVVTRLNFGLGSLVDTGPLTTGIDDSNVAEIVRASEALGELIRRTRDALIAAGTPITGDEVLQAIGSDLTDEVIDGQGGPGADARIAAVASVAAAQVALETMANQLHVNGSPANAAMTSSIEQISEGSPQTLAELTVTAQILHQARLGIAAAAGATGDASLDALREAGLALQAGLDGSLVQSLLPASYRETMDSALATVAAGNAAMVGDVNAVVRDGDPDPNINEAPVINGTPADAVQANNEYVFVPTAFDPDGDTLNFSANGLPGWASIDPVTGEVSGTPGESAVGSYSGITVTVTDGLASATLGPFSIEVTPPPVVNNPPSIGGSPPSTAQANTAYSFTPTASDPDGDTLTFEVENLPSWADFDADTGRIAGTPGDADVGTYSGIVITVSDAANSDSLGPFSITVNAISTGTVTLNWTPPTENADGTPLTDLAGFKIYWGQDGNFGNSVAIDNPGITTYVVENVPSGTWEFVSTAYNMDGLESDYSNVATRQVP